ncbi:MAG: hypothetical protein U0359_41895 [Byssovorax sp.]
MRRIRKEATKVWHNPDINTFTRRGNSSSGGPSRPATETAEDKRAAKQHRAALEALFAPKPDPASEAESKRGAPSSSGKSVGKIVLPPPPQSDSRTMERQKLLGKLLGAEGRPAVSKAADEFIKAGFTFPDDQDVHLKRLEHGDEAEVRSAIEALTALLAGELPKRRAVLESRLKRLEQFAEEPATRQAAERLRRSVSGRPNGPSTPATG